MEKRKCIFIQVLLRCLKNDIMTFVGNWVELEKNHSNCGIPDSERRLWYGFAYMWILTMEPQRVGKV